MTRCRNNFEDCEVLSPLSSRPVAESEMQDSTYWSPIKRQTQHCIAMMSVFASPISSPAANEVACLLSVKWTSPKLRWFFRCLRPWSLEEEAIDAKNEYFPFNIKPFFLFLVWFCLRVVAGVFFHPIGVDESVGIAVVVGDVVGGGISAITNMVSPGTKRHSFQGLCTWISLLIQI